MRRRFFVEKFHSGSAVISGETAEHLARVLRAEAGQLYELSDGGEVWLARVEEVSGTKRGGVIEFSLIERVPSKKSEFAPELLIALIKFDRLEWCLEKATELGVARIVPLIAARTDKPLVGASEKRRTRWQKILLESAQQSRRLSVPVLGVTEKWEAAFSQRAGTSTAKILLSERPGARPILRIAESATSSLRDPALAIGPEGGWTDAEFTAAQAAGFVEASLGENILRAETAVIASLAILRAASER